MDFLWDKITEWLKEMLIGGIVSNLSGMGALIGNTDFSQLRLDISKFRDMTSSAVHAVGDVVTGLCILFVLWLFRVLF